MYISSPIFSYQRFNNITLKNGIVSQTSDNEEEDYLFKELTNTQRDKVKTINFICQPFPYNKTKTGIANIDDDIAPIYYIYDDNRIDVYLENYRTVYANENCGGLFGIFNNLNYINGLENVDFSKCKYLTSTFYKTKLLDTSFLSTIDTSNVIKLNNCFQKANINIDNIKNWNTSNCVKMQSVFLEALSAKEEIVLNWDTSSCNNMQQMFSQISENVKTIDISSFDTSQVTTFYYMFFAKKGSNPNLSNIINNFDFSNAVNLSGMFGNCKCLTKLPFEQNTLTDGHIIGETLKELNLSSMFQGCRGFNGNITLKFNHVEGGSVNFTSIFESCDNLESISIIGNCHASSLKRFAYFSIDGQETSNPYLSYVDLSGIKNDTELITTDELTDVFRDCPNLHLLKLSKELQNIKQNEKNLFNLLSEYTNFAKPNKVKETTYDIWFNELNDDYSKYNGIKTDSEYSKELFIRNTWIDQEDSNLTIKALYIAPTKTEIKNAIYYVDVDNNYYVDENNNYYVQSKTDDTKWEIK